MKRLGLTPLLVLAAIATAMLVAASYSPVFPGDRELARFIQSRVPAGAWARAVTRAAYAPWVYGVLLVSAIAAYRVAGWRAAAAMAVTFFALMYIEPGMKASMLHDLEAGNRLELDWLTGKVVELGHKHGVAVPASEAVYAAVKLHRMGKVQ